MLAQLYIRNVAVIQEASIDLAKGLNVFTGETGAGKSVLIHSINAVLGERTSKDIIRTGEKKALVSALFTGLPPRVYVWRESWDFRWRTGNCSSPGRSGWTAKAAVKSEDALLQRPCCGSWGEASSTSMASRIPTS